MSNRMLAREEERGERQAICRRSHSWLVEPEDEAEHHRDCHPHIADHILVDIPQPESCPYCPVCICLLLHLHHHRLSGRESGAPTSSDDVLLSSRRTPSIRGAF